VTQARVTGPRPRDRRKQILTVAAERFRTSGYPNVGITEIADAVGITGAAVYRHFRGKQDLLLATIQDAFELFATVWGRDYADLRGLLTAMSALALQRRDIGVLWEREVTHLPVEVQRELRAQFLGAAEPVRAAIAKARPDLPPDAVDLRLWGVMGVLVSVGYHSIKLDPKRFQTRFVESTYSICMATPAASDDDSAVIVARGPGGSLLPASRREAILVAATRLFSGRGYQSVGVDDIGAAAGITGASVYHHFASKSAILTAAMTRCVEAMFFDLSTVLETAESPAAALDRLLRYFVRTSVEHPRMGTLLSQTTSLPDEERQQLRQSQHDYVAEWVALLVAHRPDLSEADARALVQATISQIHALLRIPHLRHRPAFDRELVMLGRAVLGLTADGR
jgi:AcrR family transcriptional regulator